MNNWVNEWLMNEWLMKIRVNEYHFLRGSGIKAFPTKILPLRSGQ